MNIDKVCEIAEAIWKADVDPNQNILDRTGIVWDDIAEPHKRWYRRMAQAAIDALQLQERVQNHAGVTMRSYRTPWTPV